MNATFFVLVVIAAVIAIAIGALRKLESGTGSFRLTKPLSDAEQTLYWRLREALPECVVLSQVTFSRFLTPQRVSASQRQALFNKVSQKSIDFLVCLKDFTVIAAVELDDKSHSSTRDAKRDAVLRTAGVSVVRVHVKNMPSVDELRTLFTA